MPALVHHFLDAEQIQEVPKKRIGVGLIRIPQFDILTDPGRQRGRRRSIELDRSKLGAVLKAGYVGYKNAIDGRSILASGQEAPYDPVQGFGALNGPPDRKSTRLNSS